MRYPSDSQRALAAELERDGESLRKRLGGVVHRTALWRFAAGLRRPEEKAKLAMHTATEGRVPQDGWATAKERRVISKALQAADAEPEVKSA